MHLEDRLQEIYFKSKMLSEYLCVHQKLCMKELSRVLGYVSFFQPTEPQQISILSAVEMCRIVIVHSHLKFRIRPCRSKKKLNVCCDILGILLNCENLIKLTSARTQGNLFYAVSNSRAFTYYLLISNDL